MIFRFGKRSKQGTPSWLEVFNSRIKDLLVRLNHYLQHRTAGIGRVRLRFCCLALLAGFAIWNAWLIITAFYHPVQQNKMDQIKVPQYIIPPRGNSRWNAARESMTGKGLLDFIDSLKRGEQGKSRFDSMIRLRPGLLDTITELEKHYGIQH